MFIEALFIMAKKQKQPRCPSTGEIDKQNAVYLSDGLPLGNKKEQTTDIRYDVAKPPKPYAK